MMRDDRPRGLCILSTCLCNTTSNLTRPSSSSIASDSFINSMRRNGAIIQRTCYLCIKNHHTIIGSQQKKLIAKKGISINQNPYSLFIIQPPNFTLRNHDSLHERGMIDQETCVFSLLIFVTQSPNLSINLKRQSSSSIASNSLRRNGATSKHTENLLLAHKSIIHHRSPQKKLIAKKGIII